MPKTYFTNSVPKLGKICIFFINIDKLSIEIHFLCTCAKYHKNPNREMLIENYVRVNDKFLQRLWKYPVTC